MTSGLDIGGPGYKVKSPVAKGCFHTVGLIAMIGGTTGFIIVTLTGFVHMVDFIYPPISKFWINIFGVVAIGTIGITVRLRESVYIY